MVSFRSVFRSVKVCPKTGRIFAARAGWKNALFLFPVMGLAALLWFCIRVIPKPSRIHYPCQQVAVPLASGFLLWLASFTAAVAIFRKSITLFRHKHIVVGAVCFAIAIAFFVVSSLPSARPSYGATQPALSTLPIGTAKGIFPGRVVWARDITATNQNCTQAAGDYYWMDKNTIQAIVDQMVSNDLQALTGTTSDSAAWVALFKYFNKQKYGLDNTGYTAGEKIVVKVNLTSGNAMVATNGGYTKGSYLDVTDTSPQIMRSILKQLINVVHVAPTDIYIGDPNKPFFDQFFTLIQPQFPTVNYIDAWGTSGRMPATPTASPAIFYSDRNLPNPVAAGYTRHASEKLPQCFVDARYLISLAPMKAHEAGGVTMCAKNHFGSQCDANAFTAGQGGAWRLHYTLPLNAPGYGIYRALVDLMGHKDLGGKTLLSVIDGLWSGHTSLPTSPNKWKSLGNTYPSSIFMSQDIVAIEAVGFDFLKEEYRTPNYTAGDWLYPNSLNGVGDYLYQAADKANWPATLGGQAFPGYDPEGDGTFIGSLGVLDHWNNATDKKYSRNLDPVNGKGIELVTAGATAVCPGSAVKPAQALVKSKSGALYSANGRLVATPSSATGARSAHLSRGTYIYHAANGESGKYVPVEK
jgi:hypothetical protein